MKILFPFYRHWGWKYLWLGAGHKIRNVCLFPHLTAMWWASGVPLGVPRTKKQPWVSRMSATCFLWGRLLLTFCVWCCSGWACTYCFCCKGHSAVLILAMMDTRCRTPYAVWCWMCGGEVETVGHLICRCGAWGLGQSGDAYGLLNALYPLKEGRLEPPSL